MSKIYILDDGSIMTTQLMMDQTGWAYGTCRDRLTKYTSHADVFQPRMTTRNGRTYTLDDGSTWTPDTLSEYLKCKRSTAGTRLSMMKGESKRILAPVKRKGCYEDAINSEQLRERISKRMYNDTTGFWQIFNKMGVVK